MYHTIYEGIQLVTLKSEGYKISKEAQIIFTIALIGIIVIGSILMIDILLNRIARNVIKRISDPVNIMDNGHLSFYLIYTFF